MHCVPAIDPLTGRNGEQAPSALGNTTLRNENSCLAQLVVLKGSVWRE